MTPRRTQLRRRRRLFNDFEITDRLGNPVDTQYHFNTSPYPGHLELISEHRYETFEMIFTVVAKDGDTDAQEVRIPTRDGRQFLAVGIPVPALREGQFYQFRLSLEAYMSLR